MEAQEDVRNTACGHKRKQVFIYGNYKNYYGYRIDQNQREDPRLAVMKKGWFEGKDCLDIGCNQGLITIEIAKKFFCRSILGIDIDAGYRKTALERHEVELLTRAKMKHLPSWSQVNAIYVVSRKS